MSHDPFDLQARADAEKSTEDRRKLQAKEEADDFKWLMQSRRGRRIVFRQIAQAGVMQLSFDVNSARMAFNEGRRNEGLSWFAKVMSLTPELFATMAKENEENA